MMNFQTFNLIEEFGLAGQQGWDRNHGPQRGGHARLECEAWQYDGADTPRNRAIDERSGDFGGRD